jgi:hypothetical protein
VHALEPDERSAFTVVNGVPLPCAEFVIFTPFVDGEMEDGRRRVLDDEAEGDGMKIESEAVAACEL